jgi:hypothetical protein
MSELTRGQVAYRGFAQVFAWVAMVLKWIAPLAYAIECFTSGLYLAGAYAAVGCFVVFDNAQKFAQNDADGK